MTDPHVHRRLGGVEARVRKIEGDMRAMRNDVREIRDAVLHARGAWRMLLLLGAVVAAVASAMATLFGWLVQR